MDGWVDGYMGGWMARDEVDGWMDGDEVDANRMRSWVSPTFPDVLADRRLLLGGTGGEHLRDPLQHLLLHLPSHSALLTR